MTELELFRFKQLMEGEVYGKESYLFVGDKREEEDEIDFYLRIKGRSDKRGRRWDVIVKSVGMHLALT